MKGIILAGGVSTRLFPLTHTTSKQLLPVYDRQMIFYPLNTLVQAGIEEILVIIAPRDAGQFLNLLGPIFDKYNISLSFKVQPVPGGLGQSFILGEDFIDDQPIALILGDNIFTDRIDLRNVDNSGAHIFLSYTNYPEKYGVVEFDKIGKITRITEKPTHLDKGWAITGFYFFDKEVVRIAKSQKPSKRGELEITDIINVYHTHYEVIIHKLEGEWFDAGTFDDLLKASIMVKQLRINEKFDPRIDEAISEFNDLQRHLVIKQLKQ